MDIPVFARGVSFYIFTYPDEKALVDVKRLLRKEYLEKG
jgi:hypothetical protein